MAVWVETVGGVNVVSEATSSDELGGSARWASTSEGWSADWTFEGEMVSTSLSKEVATASAYDLGRSPGDWGFRLVGRTCQGDMRVVPRDGEIVVVEGRAGEERWKSEVRDGVRTLGRGDGLTRRESRSRTLGFFFPFNRTVREDAFAWDGAVRGVFGDSELSSSTMLRLTRVLGIELGRHKFYSRR